MSPFIYSHNRIIIFYPPVPTFIYLWEIYIFPGSVCLFWCRKICGPIMGIYKSPQSQFMCLWSIYSNIFPHDCGNWDLGRAIPRKGIHEWDFRCSAGSVCLFNCRKYVDRSWDYINRSQTPNVEIRTEAAQISEKEYINAIFVAVLLKSLSSSFYIIFLLCSTVLIKFPLLVDILPCFLPWSWSSQASPKLFF